MKYGMPVRERARCTQGNPTRKHKSRRRGIIEKKKSQAKLTSAQVFDKCALLGFFVSGEGSKGLELPSSPTREGLTIALRCFFFTHPNPNPLFFEHRHVASALELNALW